MAAQTSYLSDLANKYYASMKHGTSAPKNKTVSVLGAGRGMSTWTPAPAKSFVETAFGSESTIGKVIDVLSRPAYASGIAIKETIKNVQEGITNIQEGKPYSVGDAISSGWNETYGAALSGLSGRDKTMPSQAILSKWEPKSGIEGVGRFATGLGLDIGLDPLTYVGGLGLAKLVGKIPQVAKATESLRAAGMLAKKAGPALTEAKVATKDIASSIKEVPNAVDVTSFTNTVKKVATKKQVAGTQYDLTTLPTLFRDAIPNVPKATKIADEVAKTKVPSPIEWLIANKDMPVALTGMSGNKLQMLDGAVASSDALTIGQYFERNVLQNRNLGKTLEESRAKANLGQLYKDSYASLTKGAGQSAPVVSKVALEAQDAALGVSREATRAGRIAGAAKDKVVAEWKDRLTHEDYLSVVSARSAASESRRIQEILTRAHSPVIDTGITDAQSTAAGVMDSIIPKSLNPLRPATPAVERAINIARKQFKPPKGFKYRSETNDVARNAEIIGKGEGIADRGFNKRAQSNMWSSLVRDASKSLYSSGLRGPYRASAMKEMLMPQLDEAARIFRSRGIEPILGSGHTGMPLSMHDILSSLEASKQGNAVLLNHVFDTSTLGSVANTNLADASEYLINILTEKGITTVKDAMAALPALRKDADLMKGLRRQIAKDPGGDYVRTEDAIARRLANNQPEIVAGVTKRIPARDIWKTVNGKRVITGKTDPTNVKVGGAAGNEIVKTIADALMQPETVGALVGKAVKNAAAHNARLGYEVPRITNSVVKEFLKTWKSSTTSTGEAIKMYQSVHKVVDGVAMAEGASATSTRIAKDMVDLGIIDNLTSDLPVIDNISRIVDAVRRGDTEAVTRIGQEAHNLQAAGVTEASLTNIVDLGDNIEGSLNGAYLANIFPFVTKTPDSLVSRLAQGIDTVTTPFQAGAGHMTLRPAVIKSRNVIRDVSADWRTNYLAVIDRAYAGKPDDLAALMVRAQRNELGVVAEDSAEGKLQHLISVLFESKDDVPGAAGAFFRNGFDLEHLNSKLRLAGLPDDIRFDAARAVDSAAANGTEYIDELTAQWKTWKFTDSTNPAKDAIDTLAKIQAALSAVTVEAATARDGYRIAKSLNLVSMTKQPGWKMITDSGGKSIMAKYLPARAWYHPDIVDELRSVDRTLTANMAFSKDNPFGRFINNYYDPAQAMFKSGMTVWRPGFHLRNLFGDESLAFNADGLQPIRLKYAATKMMGMRKSYTDWDALRALQGIPASHQITKEALARGNFEVATLTLKGGKKISIDANVANKAMRDRGALLGYVSSEDLIVDPTASKVMESFQKGIQIFGGKAKAVAGRVSEAREDYTRISHFLHVLEKNKQFRSVGEAMDFAAARVRKYHPDGTDLSPFATKYMRRLIPFYSWSSKALPLVAESMLMHPGRVMIWPKSMFNMAVANGVDLNSISDPFPEDQLFPQFVRDMQTGPQAKIDGKYYSINFGVASADVMNQFIGSPKQNIMSMLSPFIKGPIELASGQNLSTNSAIQDYGEYIEGSIPGLSQAGSLTGVSPLGTAANLASFSGAGLDPRRTNAQADKYGQPVNKVGPFNLETLLSALTGISAQNLSKPSYAHIAAIEKAAATKAATTKNVKY